MRHGWLVCLLIVVLGGAGFAQGTDGHLGTWTGTWAGSAEGGGSGELEIAIEKGKDGALGGKMKATGGESGHSAVFKTLTFDGNRMTGKYDYPLGDGGEIVLQGTFDKTSAKGTWVLTPPGQTTEAARGTWTLTKK
jgi:hypothetical protein